VTLQRRLSQEPLHPFPLFCRTTRQTTTQRASIFHILRILLLPRLQTSFHCIGDLLPDFLKSGGHSRISLVTAAAHHLMTSISPSRFPRFPLYSQHGFYMSALNMAVRPSVEVLNYRLGGFHPVSNLDFPIKSSRVPPMPRKLSHRYVI